MANTNSPFGFKPVIREGGAPFSLTSYGKAAADGAAIFMFDLVKKAATAVALPESSGYNLPGVTVGGATDVWLGSSLTYGALSTLTIHPVFDEIDVLYLAQCKTGTTISTASHVGKNADMSTTTAGSTTTKQSGQAVDGATIATTNTLGLRIRNVSMISPNAEGDSAILEVTINRHFYANQIAGV